MHEKKSRNEPKDHMQEKEQSDDNDWCDGFPDTNMETLYPIFIISLTQDSSCPVFYAWPDWELHCTVS